MANDSILINNIFEFEGEGISPVAVQNISGLNMEWGSVEFSTTAGAPNKKMATKKTVGDVTLSVVQFTDDDSFTNIKSWFASNSTDKRTCYVKVFDNQGNVAKRYELEGVWIKSLSEGDLDAAGEGESLMTEIVLSLDNLNLL